jgi:hypothetical protein
MAVSAIVITIIVIFIIIVPVAFGRRTVTEIFFRVRASAYD